MVTPMLAGAETASGRRRHAQSGCGKKKGGKMHFFLKMLSTSEDE